MAKTKQTGAEVAAERLAARDDALARVRAAIDADPTRPHLMPALARIALMGQWYFQHSFAATYGVSPGQYVTRARFAMMCDLLETTDRTVGEIMHGVGYTSFGTISRNFRHRIGCSPSQYRMWAAYAGELGTPTQP